MNKEKKPVEDAKTCTECEQLKNDNGVLRCTMFDRAIIEDATEKQCEDSIR